MQRIPSYLSMPHITYNGEAVIYGTALECRLFVWRKLSDAGLGHLRPDSYEQISAVHVHALGMMPHNFR